MSLTIDEALDRLSGYSLQLGRAEARGEPFSPDNYADLEEALAVLHDADLAGQSAYDVYREVFEGDPGLNAHLTEHGFPIGQIQRRFGENAGTSFSGVYHLTTLTPEQETFIRETSAALVDRRRAGLLDYYREVAGESVLTIQELDRKLGPMAAVWVWGRDFGITNTRVLDDRARYLIIRKLAMRGRQGEGDNRALLSTLLEGVPDARGNSMPIHIEIHERTDRQSKGVIFLLTGYGESLAMVNETITHFINAGYVVVGADQRGHGFSGNPMGMPGYMDSASNMVADLQKVLDFIRADDFLSASPLFGFGFSQGGLFHTILAQENKGAYVALQLVSPTHHLGRRFNFVTEGERVEAYAANAKLELGKQFVSVIFADPVDAPKVRFGRTPLRVEAQKWADRGFVPPYFIIKDSAVVWDEGIRRAHENAERDGPLDLSHSAVYVGTRDDNIGGLDKDDLLRGLKVVDHSQKFMGQGIQVHSSQDKDHQLLMEEPKVVRGILDSATRAFDMTSRRHRGRGTSGGNLTIHQGPDRHGYRSHGSHFQERFQPDLAHGINAFTGAEAFAVSDAMMMLE